MRQIHVAVIIHPIDTHPKVDTQMHRTVEGNITSDEAATDCDGFKTIWGPSAKRIRSLSLPQITQARLIIVCSI